MSRPRVLRRLFTLYIAAVTVGCLAVWSWFSHRVEESARAEIEASLASQSRLFGAAALGLTGPGVPAHALDELVASLGADPGRPRFTWVDPGGRVLADSHRDPATMDNHSNRPEIAGALQPGGQGSAERYSDTLARPMMYVAVAVHGASGQLAGIARTSQSLEEVDRRIGAVRQPILVGAVLVILLAIFSGLLLLRRVSRPVIQLTRMAEDLAAGRSVSLAQRVRHDEISQLARSITLMARRQQERLSLLQTERNKLVATLSGMVEGVLAVDAEEGILHLNEAASRMLKVPLERIAGRSLMDLTRVPRLGEIVRQTLAEGCVCRDEIRLATDRVELLVELIASPLRDAGGRISGAVAVLHDVTELRRLETVRQDFVANVSHELKTPIAAMRGVLETIRDDPAMPEDVRRHFVNRGCHQMERLSALVDDLLVLSRIESSRDHLHEPLELRDEIHQSLQKHQPIAEQKGIELRSELDAGSSTILGEEEYLRQIIDNLLSNAIRYTPEGGRVTVRLLAESGSRILEVEDTGIGIEPGEQDRIFERFFRVDRARSRELGGTGLGLAIVKHATERLGGHITLESILGQGSRFRVHFPQQAERATPDPG